MDIPTEIFEYIAKLSYTPLPIILAFNLRNLLPHVNDIVEKFVIKTENKWPYIYEYKLPDGRLHSIQDNPARKASNTLYWYKYGKLHRKDKPAIFSALGDVKFWYNHGIIQKVIGRNLYMYDKFLPLIPLCDCKNVITFSDGKIHGNLAISCECGTMRDFKDGEETRTLRLCHYFKKR